MNQELTQEYLKSILHYNPETGVWTWSSDKGTKVKKGDVAGYLHKTRGYVQIIIDRKKYQAHRLIFLYMTGKLPQYPQQQVDHENHIRSDNRWANLTLVNCKANSRNRSLQYNNKSGCHGVFWCKRNNKWAAQISTTGKKKHLGYFIDKQEAINARKEAEKYYGYHHNHGN